LAFGDFAQARLDLETAARLMPPSGSEPLLRLAVDAAAWPTAGVVAKRAIAQHPSADNYLEVATITAAERIGYGKRLVAANPDEPRYAYQLATEQLETGPPVDAEKTLARVGQRFTTSPTVQDHIATLLHNAHRFAAALPYRARARALDNSQPELALAFAETAQAAGHNDEARLGYLDFLDRAHHERQAYDQVLTVAAPLPFAGEVFSDARGRWPNDRGLHRRQALWLESHGDANEALAAWIKLEAPPATAFEASEAQFHQQRLKQKLLLIGGARTATH
jgi:hypothetical protein